jgi:hypothetical protein
MGIEPGQLRRWCDDVDGLTGTFIVLRSEGMLYPGGLRRGEPQQEHWEILMSDGLGGGWSERLLTELSEAIDESR